MSTDAPPPMSPARVVAVISGLVALVGALLLPFAPVSMSVPEVRWPADVRDPAPTMLMLTAYDPLDLEARFSCRVARAAEATPEGLVLSTTGPAARDVDAEALTVRARDGAVTIRSGGATLFAGPVPPGDCRFLVAGDDDAMRVVLDGSTVSVVPSRTPAPDPDVLPESEPVPATISALPGIDALRTSTAGRPDASADDLSVRLTVDDAFAHGPAPLKGTLIALVVAALLAGAVALAVEGTRRRGLRLPGRGWIRRVRLRAVDVVVPATLLAWLVLAPMTDDDGYYSAMAANVPFSGYVPNYYQLANQGFTPFSWPYYALSWWQTTAGAAPVVLRVPALLLGLGTWALIRVFVARAGLLGAVPGDGTGDGTRLRRWAHPWARVALAAGFLAWWLPYDMGVRPEPVVAFFSAAALVAVAEGLERHRTWLLGLAVGLASAGLMAAPTGFTALAPLLVAAPAVWRRFRREATSWWAVAGRWVVVLAPVAVGSLLGFADGAYRDFVRSQEIFAPIQRAQTWYEEVIRYGWLLGDDSHFGSYARRAAVLVCLLALVGFLVLLVAARVRDVVVPSRLPLAGWTTVLAFVLLLPTPSAPTHHFGALAGVGAAFLALFLADGPHLLAAVDRGRAVPRPALLAAGAAAVLVFALAGHGRNLWPFSWGLGVPDYGGYPALGGLALDQPLWWALGLVAVTVAVWVLAARYAPTWRRLAPALAIPPMVGVFLLTSTGWMLGDLTRATVTTTSTWSPQADAWNDPGATRCGAAGQMDVLAPGGGRALPRAAPSAPLPPADAAGAVEVVAAEPATDAVPLAPDLPAGIPVFGNDVVPATGTTPDARPGTVATDWYRLPAPPTDGAVVVGVSGGLDGEDAPRVEYGRETAGGFEPVGSGRPLADAESSPAWRTVPLLDDLAPPPGADVVRLLGAAGSSDPEARPAFTAPFERPWVALDQVLPADAPVGVAWQVKFLFPCQRQPRQQAGVTEPAAGAIGMGHTREAALADWMFDPDRGGLLGHAHREADVTRLTARFRDVDGEVDDLWVLRYRQPFPAQRYELVREHRTVSGLP
ncbi:arabinosyltransferase domain-containing protein [Actinomycetospora lutea]|uniref:arabinosyltransferase domain-containing protein n=1 Tax=Actinomycetospora lutea TaxID=663604 RepID=UPI002366D4D2|nr:arabinosyltransferase domain-containing protein [Actinomycetospora lutea]MDD7940970.1 arabinosyltransferase domain-containing protein [Actinomycetospora lutea]